MGYLALTIGAGASISNEFGMQGRNFALGVICPDDWTAADLGFETSVNGTDWFLVKNELGTVKFTSLPTTGGFAFSLNAMNSIMPFSKLRLKSLNTSTEAAVNQAAARTIYVYTVDLK